MTTSGTSGSKLIQDGAALGMHVAWDENERLGLAVDLAHHASWIEQTTSELAASTECEVTSHVCDGAHVTLVAADGTCCAFIPCSPGQRCERGDCAQNELILLPFESSWRASDTDVRPAFGVKSDGPTTLNHPLSIPERFADRRLVFTAISNRSALVVVDGKTSTTIARSSPPENVRELSWFVESLAAGSHEVRVELEPDIGRFTTFDLEVRVDMDSSTDDTAVQPRPRKNHRLLLGDGR